MKITIKDEHCPDHRSFQIVSEGKILASNVSPAFAMWIADAAAALEEVKAKAGMCIYGTPAYRTATDEVLDAFRNGSAHAFNETAELATVPFGEELRERETEIVVVSRGENS